MRRRLFQGRLLLFGLLLLQIPAQAADEGYDYPFSDPLVSTILGTPPAQKTPLLENIPVKLIDLNVFPAREIPDLFWYNDRLRCSLAYQEGKAPLIFVIAGTGAGFNSDKMLFLQSVFYRAGFHVVSISSPTHANFVVSASASSTPGIIREDARDLYRAMQQAWERVRDDTEVDGFYLAGYSLGASQAAFVSQIDESRKSFNFKKVLMINPAVNLYSSASRLDRMLEDNVPGGVEKTGELLRRMMDRMAEIYSAGDFVKFDHEFLFNLYRGLPEPPEEENLAVVIGLSFRVSASNMIFSADVMNDAGFIVPRGTKLDNNDSLNDYLRTAMRISFVRYLDEFLLPSARRSNPQLTRETLIAEDGLEAIEVYLRQARKIGVLTNKDDIILAPGDLDFLHRVFGSRITTFPSGGHCGNLEHRAVTAAMIDFLVTP